MILNHIGVANPVNIQARQVDGVAKQFDKKDLNKLQNTIDEILKDSWEDETSSTTTAAEP